MSEKNKGYWLFIEGIESVDQAAQIINKKFGGSEHFSNFIPLNSKVSLSL